MDQLSDILSSFFVNPNNKKKSSREKKKSRTEIATQTEIDTITVKDTEPTVKEPTVKEPTVDTEPTVKEPTVKEPTVKEPTVKEPTVKEPTVKEPTVDTEPTVKEPTVKEPTVKEPTVKEPTVKEPTVKEPTVKEPTVKEPTVDTEPTVKESKGSIYSDLSSDNTSEDILLRKYILKPSDFHKKNIMIINKDFESSIIVLSEILYKLSIMKNIDKIFSSNVYITSTDEHKSIYKQILLNNPHLYFTDLNVKNKLDKSKLKYLDELRTIHIIDNELLSTIDAKEFEYLLNNDVLLIIMAKDDDKNAITTYDLLTSNKILIHKLYGSKTIQKNFYKIFIKYICKEQVSTFENYYKMINNENLDIKYLILKNDELRYN